MPRDDNLQSILIIGAGPIVIGQACEFDYSGTQACRALKEEGYRVILVNSNPATIMTDPSLADATYIEPVTPDIVSQIIAQEKPDALLPTVGGQTGLNCALELDSRGVLAEHHVALLAADAEVIRRAEDRDVFKRLMETEGIATANGGLVRSLEESETLVESLRFPLILRPSFTLGGTGGSLVYNREEYAEKSAYALAASPIGEVLIEEALMGWKEFELEVMRDGADNALVVCSIENIDPMGVHTGDSVTVAPAQTLSDREYQQMRDWALRCIRAVGVKTGGSNVQFAVNPDDGRMVIIEMNPRVSRSSALASKATGFPIAKVAAKLAVGYLLDEITNDITGQTLAAYEPALDYVVTKVPRFNFEKFPRADGILGVQMQSVGEVMAIGRTFQESIQKAYRSLEEGLDGLEPRSAEATRALDLDKMRFPTAFRLLKVQQALAQGRPVDEVHELTSIDPWFLHQINEIAQVNGQPLITAIGEEADDDQAAALTALKQQGFSDVQIGRFTGQSEEQIHALRLRLGVVPAFKSVDTCAAEFSANTPYCYSSYETENEVRPLEGDKVIILGSGPNRIGQGIEFDYCCVQALFALQEMGYKAIMHNCNPETVSTDFDMADRLYFEPLTFEDVMAVIDQEQPLGVMVQFGGQTPLALAGRLAAAGVNILGTSPEAIDLAEDREKFGALLDRLKIARPDYGIAHNLDEATRVAGEVGYPVLVRPSYVLGGRAMEIVQNPDELERYVQIAAEAGHGKPVLIDKYLEGREIEVDAVCDGEQVLIPGIMEHIERAGVHSGDSMAVYPPVNLTDDETQTVADYTQRIGLALEVRGLMNVQYVIMNESRPWGLTVPADAGLSAVYVIEVNPRSSRTVPFISKVTGIPLVRLATNAMLGRSLKEQGYTGGLQPEPPMVSVKAPVFSMSKLRGVDTYLGPEMKSTGEVMGIDTHLRPAVAKALEAAGLMLPPSGALLITIADRDKAEAVPWLKLLGEQGYRLYATGGTAALMRRLGLEVTEVAKVGEPEPNSYSIVADGTVDGVVNTVAEVAVAMRDGFEIRRAATERRIPCYTSMDTARAAIEAVVYGRGEYSVARTADYVSGNVKARSGV